MSDQWLYWLEYNAPTIVITLLVALWVTRLGRRQFERNDAMLAMGRENSERFRQMIVLLEEIRNSLKGKP